MTASKQRNRETNYYKRKSTGHVIEDISYQLDMIKCVCDWEGRIDDFRSHQDEAEPTQKKLKDTRFAGSFFPRPPLKE